MSSEKNNWSRYIPIIAVKFLPFCPAVPCRAVPCRAVPCRAVPCRAVPCPALPFPSPCPSLPFLRPFFHLSPTPSTSISSLFLPLLPIYISSLSLHTSCSSLFLPLLPTSLPPLSPFLSPHPTFPSQCQQRQPLPQQVTPAWRDTDSWLGTLWTSRIFKHITAPSYQTSKLSPTISTSHRNHHDQDQRCFTDVFTRLTSPS